MQLTNITETHTHTHIAEVRTDAQTGNRSLFAKKDFDVDDEISPFYWHEVFETPNYLTVQISENEHIILQPTLLECANHSCSPNAFFDTTSKQLICISQIVEGEEITFFYPSAEWDMDRAFECLCGSKACIGFIRGAKYLSKNEINNYRFTAFIAKKINDNL